jgi:hypothetical protein
MKNVNQTSRGSHNYGSWEFNKTLLNFQKKEREP